MISNCAIHTGMGIGIELVLSKNIIIKNNTVYNHVRYGINVDNSSELLIEGNWVLGIFSRHIEVTMVGDPIGGIIGCANRI